MANRLGVFLDGHYETLPTIRRKHPALMSLMALNISFFRLPLFCFYPYQSTVELLGSLHKTAHGEFIGSLGLQNFLSTVGISHCKSDLGLWLWFSFGVTLLQGNSMLLSWT